MRKNLYLVPLVLLVLLACVGAVQAQTGDDQTDLTHVVTALDGAVTAMRKGEDSQAPLLEAKTLYASAFSSRVENSDNQLNTSITEAFASASTLTEENIFALKANVISAGGELGVFISPLKTYSLFIILGISVAVSALVTLFSRKTVNWELIRDCKAKISEFTKEYRDAVRKQDKKRMHKLEPKRAEIQKLQGIVMTQTMKPTLFYMIPLFIVWTTLTLAFSGWVVAWLPFSVDLPIFGRLVAFGVGWWYFITYMGTSMIFRSILIRESSPAGAVTGTTPKIEPVK
jgi:uncharacterized membrane protein (DUF106 family)